MKTLIVGTYQIFQVHIFHVEFIYFSILPIIFNHFPISRIKYLIFPQKTHFHHFTPFHVFKLSFKFSSMKSQFWLRVLVGTLMKAKGSGYSFLGLMLLHLRIWMTRGRVKSSEITTVCMRSFQLLE